MTPTHHPDPDDLLSYATGTAEEWRAVVIACHLTYCPDCRSEVGTLEDLGGVLLDTLEGEAGLLAPSLPPAAAPERVAKPKKTYSNSTVARSIPRPLHAYFKETTPAWRFLAPGLKHVPTSLTVGDMPARIIQFKPGFVIPDHRHDGTEMVLVLDGVLEDTVTKDVFRTGDLSRRDETTGRHGNVVTSADPCVCLVVNDGPIDPSTMWGKLLKALTGL
jgi:putative transcriptional regulator